LWSFGIRASVHTIHGPFRLMDAGARVVFRSGPEEQRIVVEIVDGSGRILPVGGWIDGHGVKSGVSCGEFEGGRVKLEPPFGARIEGDLRAVAVLEDGETFEMIWPEEVWSTAQSVTITRGDGRAAMTLEVGGVVTDIRAVDSYGMPISIARLKPPRVHGATWWEPVEAEGAIRVCLPSNVQRLWCVARRVGESGSGDRVVVLERTDSSTFAVKWVPGRMRGLVNEGLPGPLRSVLVQVAIPDMPSTEDRRWLTISSVSSEDLRKPVLAFCPEDLETRVRILKAEGPPVEAVARWR
jgi:hypothetical protein